MKNNKVNIELDIEDLLGLTEPKKNTLEYDLNFILDNGWEDYLKQQQEQEEKKQEFISLFKECFDELCDYMEKDPLQRIAISCFTCQRGIELRDKYGTNK